MEEDEEKGGGLRVYMPKRETGRERGDTERKRETVRVQSPGSILPRLAIIHLATPLCSLHTLPFSLSPSSPLSLSIYLSISVSLCLCLPLPPSCFALFSVSLRLPSSVPSISQPPPSAHPLSISFSHPPFHHLHPRGTPRNRARRSLPPNPGIHYDLRLEREKFLSFSFSLFFPLPPES